MTPEQHFILSLLSPMKTFPMVIPGHLRARIDRYRILRAQTEPLNTSDIVRQALTLFAYARPNEREGLNLSDIIRRTSSLLAYDQPIGRPTVEMDGQGKAANVKLPTVVIEYIEREANFYNQTKSDIARSAIVWFLDQMEAGQ